MMELQDNMPSIIEMSQHLGTASEAPLAAPPTPAPTAPPESQTPVLPTFVYALGRIEPRFPTLALEKEFAQVTGRAETAGTEREALQSVLSDRSNRYLARQLCWVFSIEGL
jgi:hypothetical protein